MYIPMVLSLCLVLALGSCWLGWWLHLGMVVMRSMQDWQKVKLIFFMNLSRRKRVTMKEAIRILTTRSKTQLLATFNRYRDDHGTSITKVQMKKFTLLIVLYILIKRKFICIIVYIYLLQKLLDNASDDFHKALHTAIRCITDHKKYYEKVII